MPEHLRESTLRVQPVNVYHKYTWISVVANLYEEVKLNIEKNTF